MSAPADAPVREDLLHLTPEALTHAANAGLVKRAMRELAGGDRPELDIDDDGLLQASFEDGTLCRWPRAVALPDVRCSCGAPGICRHRLIAALAYGQALHAAAASPTDGPASDSRAADVPAGHAPRAALAGPRPVHEAEETTLVALLPPAVLKQAQTLREHGLTIELRPRGHGGDSGGSGDGGEPCDTARLPSATVRFWAGAGLEAARCDCIRATACEHVALGFWAFREAHRQGLSGAVTVSIAPAVEDREADAGPAPSPAGDGRAARTDKRPSSIVAKAAFESLADALLRHGAVGGASALAQPLSIARTASGDAAWLLGALDELEAWSDAYMRRSARYDAADGADLLAELGLRLAGGARPGRAGDAWGTGQPGEVELDRVRLACLGARTRRDGAARRTSLVMADLDTGTRLLLRHDWTVPEDRLDTEAAVRGSERLAPGLLLPTLGRGQLLSRQARRLPDGSLRLAKHRSDRNQPLPQTADWQSLRMPLRADSVAALRRERALHPHPDLAPRHAARRFVIFAPADWGEPFYDAHEQTVATVLRDADGAPLLAHRAHERHVPQALEAIAQALAPQAAPRHVAGMLRWRQGLPEIEIWAIAGDAGLTVPDLSAPEGQALAALPLGHVPRGQGQGGGVLGGDGPDAMRALIATLLHHGRSQLPPSWRGEARALQRRSGIAGWRALAEALEALLTALDEPDALDAAGARRAKTAGEAGHPPDTHPAGAALLRLLALLRLHEDAAELELGGLDDPGDPLAE